jgi:hypothetical protein
MFLLGSTDANNPPFLRTHNKIMSSGEEGLRAMVLEWAKNNEERCAKWLAELKDNDIEDMQTLEERSESSRWQKTLDELSNGLVAKLEKWYKEKHPESKCLSNIIRLTTNYFCHRFDCASRSFRK